MKMQARVRATVWLDLGEVDVPEPDVQTHPRTRTSSPGMIVANEDQILDARRSAAELAEHMAAERFPGAEILVEEVIETAETGR
jgi:hypothetical protein